MSHFSKAQMTYQDPTAAGLQRSADTIGPAIGLVMAAATSLVLWFGLAHLASYAAHALF